MDRNQIYWIRDPVNIWTKAYIVDYTTRTFMIKDTHETVTINDEDILYRNTDKEDYCTNLMNLIHLNEASILNTIQLRYDKDQIYTFNDNILLATNPFKYLDVYNKTDIDNYYKLNNEEPHPFLIAKRCLDELYTTKKDQSILVSGESGAGKTQTTKYLMNYISYSTNSNIKDFGNKIIASTPILEAFGNAKTIRNDNSSRFGKFIKILFNIDNCLVGAKIKTYLLEKIRVTNVANDERNYHIFYMILASLSDDELSKYRLLPDTDSYYYLNQSQCRQRTDNVNDENSYNELMISFKVLNFTTEDIGSILSILSFILNLGNVNFNDNFEKCIYIENCISLLGLDKTILIDLLKYRYIDYNTKPIQIENTEKEFITIRDTLAQILYSLLFSYLVTKINESIESDNFDNFIGILDIFGFEVFKNNGLEQLCINWTNEKLQNLFNKYIFELEQKEYIKEDILWENINYPDNSDIIDLIENKVTGIFSLLQEQCTLKSGSDSNLYLNICKFLENHNKLAITSKDKVSSKLSVIHYAGCVYYTINNFVTKNKNQCDTRIIELFKNSNEIIKQFEFDIYTTEKNKKKSIVYKFKHELGELIDVISSTKQHYIRCIKPNDQNQPNIFNRERVFEQLKYCGVLEAIKIARAGYPIRIVKSQFLEEFYQLMNYYQINIKEECIYIFIDKFASEFTGESVYQIGLTKIFLKREIYEYIIHKKKALIRSYAIILQKYYRRFIARKKYTRFLNFIIKSQLYWKEYVKRRKWAISIIESRLYGYSIRLKYRHIRKSVIRIQYSIKQYLIYKFYKREFASIAIQSVYRSCIRQKEYRRLIRKNISACVIQRLFRNYINRKIIFKNIRELQSLNNTYNQVEVDMQIDGNQTINITTKETELEDILEKERVVYSTIIYDKDELIQNLLKENSRLKEHNKENINTSNQTDVTDLNEPIIIDVHSVDDVNYELAEKMEDLYLKLAIQDEEISNFKKKRIEESRKKNRTFIDLLRDIFK